MNSCPRCGAAHEKNEGQICDECLGRFRKAVEEDQRDQEAIKKIVDALEKKET